MVFRRDNDKTKGAPNQSADSKRIEFSLWLEFEVWREAGSSDDPLDDFFNMEIELSDGRRYGLNVWTYQFFRRAIVQNKEENEQRVKQDYLQPPDLFVERMERDLLEEVVQDLIDDDALQEDWLILENE